MAIAFDKIDSGSHSATDGVLSWTHTPVGTPACVIVYVAIEDGTERNPTATYGGEAMAELNGGVGNLVDGGVYAFFIGDVGDTVPTGAQTVSITTDSHTSDKGGFSLSCTAADTCSVLDEDGTINSVATAGSGSLTSTLSLTSVDAFCSLGFYNGYGANSNNSGLTNWSDDTATQEIDFGTNTAGAYYYTIIAGTDVTFGVAQGAVDESIAVIGVAVRENTAGGGGSNIPVIKHHLDQMAA